MSAPECARVVDTVERENYTQTHTPRGVGVSFEFLNWNFNFTVEKDTERRETAK